MRNIIFHIIPEKMLDHYTTMDESDFYEHLESLNADSVQNQDPVDAKNSVERLVSRLQNAGLKVETATGPESEEFYVFQTGNAEETKTCKCQYFAAAFAKLQEMVGQMSLETFSSDGTEEYQLRMLIKKHVRRYGILRRLDGKLPLFGQLHSETDPEFCVLHRPRNRVCALKEPTHGYK